MIDSRSADRNFQRLSKLSQIIFGMFPSYIRHLFQLVGKTFQSLFFVDQVDPDLTMLLCITPREAIGAPR